jgi:hypothetical protein
MPDTIRVDAVEAALASLDENPERLDQARNRFYYSPPLYISQPSGTPTRTQSPEPLSEEQRLW